MMQNFSLYGGDSRRATMEESDSCCEESLQSCSSGDDGMMDDDNHQNLHTVSNHSHAPSHAAAQGMSTSVSSAQHHASLSSLQWNSLRVSNHDTLISSSPEPAAEPQFVPSRKKIIYLVRHGIAQHNVAQSTDAHKIFDASLTQEGMRQAQMTGIKFAKYLKNVVPLLQPNAPTHKFPIDTIICSPLSRCCETAMIVSQSMTSAYNQAVLDDAELQRQQREIPPSASYPSHDNHSASSLAFSPRPFKPPPILCHELLREACGIYLPDKRRPKSYLQQKFGAQISLDPHMTELDELWTPQSRETVDEVVKRANQFFTYIMTTNDVSIGDHVLLVSHGVWIECCLQAFCKDALKNGRRVYNCDVYRGELVLELTADSSTPRCQINNAHFVTSGTVF